VHATVAPAVNTGEINAVAARPALQRESLGEIRRGFLVTTEAKECQVARTDEFEYCVGDCCISPCSRIPFAALLVPLDDVQSPAEASAFPFGSQVRRKCVPDALAWVEGLLAGHGNPLPASLHTQGTELNWAQERILSLPRGLLWVINT